MTSGVLWRWSWPGKQQGSWSDSVQGCELWEPVLWSQPSVATHCHLLSLQVTRDARTYSIGVCTAAAGLDQEGCKDGGVCLLSGNKGASFGRLASMQLDYRHQDEAVILSYVNGDPCPPGNSSQYGQVQISCK